ncbi:MAG TPA: HepT-like ribonuclease domain-containing protein [Spirochaetia bacterium]|nr:HepT-like ribonuclease domain-containing protein [Spirochaetia bacterium]
MRNRIVHEYFEVDTEIVWEIVRHDLPLLGESLRRLLDDLPPWNRFDGPCRVIGVRQDAFTRVTS